VKISFFIPSMEGGGAERVILNLVNSLCEYDDVTIELVLSEAKGKYMGSISKKVKIINLENNRTLTSLFSLIKYLNRNTPDILISAITHANVIAVLAKIISRKDIKVILTQHTILSNSLKLSNKIFAMLFLKLIEKTYPLVSKIVTVSKYIEQDTIKIINIEKNKVQTIYNPIMAKNIIKQSLVNLDHDWFSSESPPVILSVGRFTKVKDFATLLHSFKLLREKINARLIILGEGEQRDNLISLAKELGIEKDVQMPGFVENPYQYMARSKVFILTSIYEGFGNVLVEALGCGTSVISTNCPGGVSEILDNGKYGSLVPIGSAELISAELFNVINNEQEVTLAERLKRAEVFTVEKITKEYMELINDTLNG